MSDHSEDATLTREGMRTPRAAAVAGIAFSVLLTAAFVLVRWALLGDPDSSGEWITDGSRRDAVVLALNLLPFAGIAFLWFMGVLRDRIGVNEDRFFATVFLGSGLLFVAMVFACAAVAGGLVLSFDGSNRPRPSSGPLDATSWSPFSACTRCAWRRSSRSRPRRSRRGWDWYRDGWWCSAWRPGLALLFTAGVVPWIEIVFPLWVLVFSVHILVATFRSPEPAGAIA